MAEHVTLPLSGTDLRTAKSAGLPGITTQLRAGYYLAQLSSGDRLPPVRALAKHLGMSPTTALDFYRTLEEAGFVHGRERSGMFLRTVGREQRRSSRDVAIFKTVGATAKKLRSEGISPVEFVTRLLHYTGTRVRDDFRFGFLAQREALETIRAQLVPHIGFELPIAWLPPADRCSARQKEPERSASRRKRRVSATIWGEAPTTNDDACVFRIIDDWLAFADHCLHVSAKAGCSSPA